MSLYYSSFILLYCFNVVGVARGSGWQLLVMWANLGTFYLIGMPIAGLLAFKFKLYAKVNIHDSVFNQFSFITLFLVFIILNLPGLAKNGGVEAVMFMFYFSSSSYFYVLFFLQGLWIGLICGLSCQAGSLLLISSFRKWTKIELSEDNHKERVSV